ncbi:MAG: invasion protein CiaB, partial [Campylobacterales bacterium]
MLQKDFLNDLSVAYLMLQESDSELQKLYEPTSENEHILKELLEIAELPCSKETFLVAASRIVSLKEDSLIQEMKKAKFSQEKIDKKLLEIYEFVSSIWLQRHQEFLDECDKKRLLSGFYRTLLRGAHKVGVELTKWQPNWTKKIIYEQNRELKQRFEDSSKVVEFLRDGDLLERDGDSEADRSYSALKKEGDSYIKEPYATAFKKDVEAVVGALCSLISNLSNLEDDVYEQKDNWIEYLNAIKQAFEERDSSKLLERWRDVDRCWMQITTPIQLGHPLEYYEDHYRKAVALEWDIRFINPKLDSSEYRGRTLKYLSDELLNAIGGTKKDRLKEAVANNIKKTQLYIGRPALFYGAELNGLFSAQVVPNDEVVSNQSGKKIFAFADFVLQSSRAKPFLELDREIFGIEFLNKERHILFKEPKLWHELYDIETIGHEYGHILFVDDDTEMVMNKSGQYKNCEEFKATCGGIVAHFYKE